MTTDPYMGEWARRLGTSLARLRTSPVMMARAEALLAQYRAEVGDPRQHMDPRDPDHPNAWLRRQGALGQGTTAAASTGAAGGAAWVAPVAAAGLIGALLLLAYGAKRAGLVR